MNIEPAPRIGTRSANHGYCTRLLGVVGPYERANILVENALHGRPPAIITPTSLAARRVYHNVIYRYLYTMVAAMDLLLAFWEPPSQLEAERPLILLRILDAVALVVFTIDSCIQYAYFGASDFRRKKWTLSKTLVLPLMYLNLFLSLPNGGRGVKGYMTVLRALRPIFLLERLRNVRKVLSNIVRMVPKVANVAILLGVSNLFFGVTGYLLFATKFQDETSVCREHVIGEFGACSVFTKTEILTGRPCYSYFSSLTESMYHLFTLQTTANFPDVMLPVYHCEPRGLAALFFMAYLLVSFFFLLNLTLAVAADEFKRLTEKKVIARYENMFRGFDQAFRALWEAESRRGRAGVNSTRGLDAEQYISRETWVDFLAVHRPAIDKELAGILFDAATSGSSRAYKYDFRRLAMHFSQVNAVADVHEEEGDVEVASANPLTAASQGKPTIRKKKKTPPSSSSDTSLDTGAVASSTTPDQKPSSPPSSQKIDPSQKPEKSTSMEVDRQASDTVEDWNSASSPKNPIFSSSSKSTVWWSRVSVRAWMEQRWVLVMFDAFVLLNAVLVLVELGGATKKGTEEAVSGVQYLTLGIFFIEVSLKVYSLGLRAFLRNSVFNRLDAVLLVLSVASLIMSLVDDAAEAAKDAGIPVNSGLVVFFRVLRTLRLLRVLPDFALTVTSFLDVLPVLANYLTVLLCVFYVFSIVGMESYAGKLPPPMSTSIEGVEACECPPNSDCERVQRVCHSPYGLERYYDLNFDTLWSTMTIMFHQLVVNNWPIIGEGLMASLETEWVRWFFVIFHLIAVVIVLNVLVAFLIESFSIQRARREAARERIRKLREAKPTTLRSALTRAMSTRNNNNNNNEDLEEEQYTSMPTFSEAMAGLRAWLTERVDGPSSGGDETAWALSVESLEREAARKLAEEEDNQRNIDSETSFLDLDEDVSSRRILPSYSTPAISPDDRFRAQTVAQTRPDASSAAQFPSESSTATTSAIVSTSLAEVPPAGEEWRAILRNSRSDTSKWRIWRDPRPQDIYDTIYQSTIHRKFPKTFAPLPKQGSPALSARTATAKVRSSTGPRRKSTTQLN